MNHYYLTIKFEGTTFEKKINIMANCKSDAIFQALDKLDDRDLDRVNEVLTISDKGNIEN